MKIYKRSCSHAGSGVRNRTNNFERSEESPTQLYPEFISSLIDIKIMKSIFCH
ncbi:MAG: hypothetical protein V1720_04305 [bacterium]